jgi:hypothetical protein
VSASFDRDENSAVNLIGGYDVFAALSTYAMD